MSSDFSYAWRLEVANPGAIAALKGRSVVFQDWEIESNAATDLARVNKFAALSSPPAPGNRPGESVVFGDVQNPGWNQGFVLKVYDDGSFVGADNSGKCLAYGSLSVTVNLDFDTLKNRLLSEGLLALPRDPLSRGLDHYRTRFVALSDGGDLQIRSDAEVVDFSKPRTHPTKKEEEFSRIFDGKHRLIESLLHAETHPVP
jgi:hypothetical protein